MMNFTEFTLHRGCFHLKIFPNFWSSPGRLPVFQIALSPEVYLGPYTHL